MMTSWAEHNYNKDLFQTISLVQPMAKLQFPCFNEQIDIVIKNIVRYIRLL